MSLASASSAPTDPLPHISTTPGGRPPVHGNHPARKTHPLKEFDYIKIHPISNTKTPDGVNHDSQNMLSSMMYLYLESCFMKSPTYGGIMVW